MITKKYKAGDITITAGKGGGIAVEFDNPPTATNGNITEEQLATLQESDANYILFNNEIYDLMDKTHSEDTLTYSHVGYENNVHLIKTISITISTLAWVLNKSEVGEGGGLSRVDTLPEPSEKSYNENKIYDQNNSLSYIGKDISYSDKDEFINVAAAGPETNNGCYNNGFFYYVDGEYQNNHTIKSLNLETKAITEIVSNDIIYPGNMVCSNNKLYIVGQHYWDSPNRRWVNANDIIEIDLSTKNVKNVGSVDITPRSVVSNSQYIFAIGQTSSVKISLSTFSNSSISIPINDFNVSTTIFNDNIYCLGNNGGTLNFISYSISSNNYSWLATPILKSARYEPFLVINDTGNTIVLNNSYYNPKEAAIYDVQKNEWKTHTIEGMPSDMETNCGCFYKNSFYFYGDAAFIYKFTPNFENVSYSAISVGGGGAEYELILISNPDEIPASQELAFNTTNALFYITFNGYTGNAITNKGQHSIIPTNIKNFDNSQIMGDSSITVISSTSEQLRIKDTSYSNHRYNVLAFRKKD